MEAIVCGVILQAGEEARKRDPLGFSPNLRALAALRGYVAALRVGMLVRPEDEPRLRFGTFSVRRLS